VVRLLCAGIGATSRPCLRADALDACGAWAMHWKRRTIGFYGFRGAPFSKGLVDTKLRFLADASRSHAMPGAG
jgi:hypothetical protein